MLWFVLPGIQGEATGKEILFATEAYVLTTGDKEQLKTVLETLSELKIYQSTEIENTLSQLRPAQGSGLSVFCQKLVNASYNGDEEGFQKLLEEVKS